MFLPSLLQLVCEYEKIGEDLFEREQQKRNFKSLDIASYFVQALVFIFCNFKAVKSDDRSSIEILQSYNILHS